MAFKVDVQVHKMRRQHKELAMSKEQREKLPPRPTDAELEILSVLWQLGPSTVRQVHEVVSTRRQTTFNTTLKFLQIMRDKGLVKHDPARRPQVYWPQVPQQQMQRRLVADFLDRAFGGSARKLVAALMETEISEKDLADIQRLIRQSKEK
jgi:BlaI family transcriptional regulator, penicillinase repressor